MLEFIRKRFMSECLSAIVDAKKFRLLLLYLIDKGKSSEEINATKSVLRENQNVRRKNIWRFSQG